MSVDLQLRYDRLFREQAVSTFKRGYGYASAAGGLGVYTETVRGWQKTYHVIERSGLLVMGARYARYDYEARVAVARTAVGGRMSKPEVVVRLGIVSTTLLKQWYKLYREGDAQALEPRPKGRPKGPVWAVPPTCEGELQEHVRRLGAQMACLKKSIALRAQRRSQTGTKPQWLPSFQDMDTGYAISSRWQALPG